MARKSCQVLLQGKRPRCGKIKNTQYGPHWLGWGKINLRSLVIMKLLCPDKCYWNPRFSGHPGHLQTCYCPHTDFCIRGTRSSRVVPKHISAGHPLILGHREADWLLHPLHKQPWPWATGPHCGPLGLVTLQSQCGSGQGSHCSFPSTC